MIEGADAVSNVLLNHSASAILEAAAVICSTRAIIGAVGIEEAMELNALAYGLRDENVRHGDSKAL